jgi:hypothetical protein
MKKKKATTSEQLVELQEKALIVKLGLAGVPQRAIREILECDLNRVTRIVRHLPKRTSIGEE